MYFLLQYKQGPTKIILNLNLKFQKNIKKTLSLKGGNNGLAVEKQGFQA